MPKRRANGEGTITSRADGRYQAAAYVYRPDGTRTRKFVYGKTRREVADKLTELQEKTRQGIPAAESTMAFGDYLTYWLAVIASQRLKPSTLNSYEGLTRLYIRPALGKKRLNRLSPADVRRFLSEFKVSCLCCLRGADEERPEDKRSCCAVGRCCERRPSARTVQYVHAVLRSALQQAMREELIARNVARIPKTCVQALTRHQAQQERERKVAGKKWQPAPGQPNGLIFTTSTGRVTDPRSLNRMLTILCRDAGVRRVRVHDLRHTCASLLLAQGVDTRTIMETLRHSTITMTLDIYAHVMNTTLKAAADRMDDALGLDDPKEDSQEEQGPDTED
ncbi:tyrosine-type recombinase/integrase [Streptomyces sasae]|uniref:tyrosine-type recombinase/integrase n=1 Tax=Streptomyces sasae TaxID=1266772 RepID=UPI00292E54DB|nr:site-specific integrase [Streptomyces sasae]